MSQEIAIRVEGLGKRYRLGLTVDLARTFREALMGLPGLFGRRAAHAARTWRERFAARALDDDASAETERDPSTPPGTFWALRDIDLEVKQGEVLGIIGRNGAGKSTLLKVLSRITSPTVGRAEVWGRVGSLLEVGTGFHPELTGRENIYLNGSILGMAKSEIDNRFDEIVDFAGTGKHLDTPVKRYSSGMRVRLGFAVAAHLEVDVLIVDEVLAVGDYLFQQKCLEKMRDVSALGKTVLFVSHNMGSIGRLCGSCVLLEAGRIEAVGSTQEIVRRYVSGGYQSVSEFCPFVPSGKAKAMGLRRISIHGQDGRQQEHVRYDERFSFRIEYEVTTVVTGALVAIGLFSSDGICAFVTGDFDAHPELLGRRVPGHYTAEVEIPEKWLNPGRFSVSVYISQPADRVVHFSGNTLTFEVLDTGAPASQQGGANFRPGPLQPILEWRTTGPSRSTSDDG